MKERFPYNDIITLLDQNRTFNLAESTSEDLLFGDILDSQLLTSLQKTKLSYGTSKGSITLRQLIAGKLNISHDKILITNGASSAIFLSLFSMCNTGDEVVTVIPNFPPTLDVISAVGATKKTIEISFDNKYQFSIPDLENKLTERTKLIILVSPHNPSGTIITDENVKSILRLMEIKSPKAYMLIDETYREATYGENIIRKSFAGFSEKILTTASLSKCHGTPGLRIGWVTCHNKTLLQQLTLAKMNTVISCSPLDEKIAVAVLQKDAEIFAYRKTILSKAIITVETWVTTNAEFIEWVKPSAGALCCIRLRQDRFSDDDVDRFYQLLPENELQLAAGNWFGQPKRIFRLGFGFLPLDTLECALKQLQKIFKPTPVRAIVNTEIKDLDFIYHLFDEAISYQRKNEYPVWIGYDKEVLIRDIKNKLQYKIVIANNIACVFSICFSDKIIWREREKGDSLYLHRIVVNPAYKGQKQFGKILNWSVEYAHKNGLSHIRMDTWAENPNLIKYYKSFGFRMVGKFTTPNSEELPLQQRDNNIVLLEFKIENIGTNSDNNLVRVQP